MSTDTTLTPAEFALRALVAAGHVTQAQVDAALTLPGAPAASRKQIKDIDPYCSDVGSINGRIQFRRGWRAAEAAHGIKP